MRDVAIVNKWVKQFPDDDRDLILGELNHLLDQTYFSKVAVVSFLQSIIDHKKFTNGDAANFWTTGSLLKIQKGGSSQSDLTDLLITEIIRKLNITPSINDDSKDHFIYLDDGIYTGRRLFTDLKEWAVKLKRKSIKVNVVVAVIYKGHFYWRDRLQDELKKEDVDLDITYWRMKELEDRKKHINKSDVLRPKILSPTADAFTKSYKYPVILRAEDSTGEANIFSSAESRTAFERAMFDAGIRVRKLCTNLPEFHRPLGYSTLETPGFGSTVITYRNCPNNTPLALWVGPPWFPLFPRKNN